MLFFSLNRCDENIRIKNDSELKLNVIFDLGLDSTCFFAFNRRFCFYFCLIAMIHSLIFLSITKQDICRCLHHSHAKLIYNNLALILKSNKSITKTTDSNEIINNYCLFLNIPFILVASTITRTPCIFGGT